MRKVVAWQGLGRGERIFVLSAAGNGRSRSRGLACLSRSDELRIEIPSEWAQLLVGALNKSHSGKNPTASMSNPFFDHPILNSPYEYPRRHWELDEAGQPTQKVIENRRSAKFVTPIPKPKKHKAAAQKGFVFDEGKGLSTKEQQYDPTSIINEVRSAVDTWRILPNPSQWQVTPETGRLLHHWRHHQFNDGSPLFCQA